MSELTIRTNHHWRFPIRGYEFPNDHFCRKEFDYHDADEFDDIEFVNYRGIWYDLSQFMATRGMPEDSPVARWHGYHGDSYFSGIVVRYSDDCEEIQIGTYMC